MPIFAEFLADAARRGEAVNTLFEERLFELVGVLQKISGALASEGIEHELIGGLAVLIHVEEANPEHATLTRDVNLMIHREDLERIKEAAAKNGFRFRHTAGLDMLIFGPTESAKNGVHLIFSGEKVRETQVLPNPPIRPDIKHVHGSQVMVIPVADLVRMKLSSYRLKDQVHIKAMDASGLVTAKVALSLDPELAARLRHVRETE